jgi:5-methyltetrahydrofolate--homocysteine methyltransferase
MTRADASPPQGRRQGAHPGARRRLGRDDPAEDLDEADFRGDRFADRPGQLKGNNDLLCLTRPDIIEGLHDRYFAAGADISETNTFSATTIAQEDYATTDAVRDINLEGARLARAAADRWTAKEPHKPRWVAGSMGPLNKMLSMSSDVNDPGARLVTFDQVYAAYREQVLALHEGGVDLFLIETITDTLNCKAAIKAIMDLEDEGLEPLPIWISGTITDRSGRTCRGRRRRRSGTACATPSRSRWASTARSGPT